MNSPFPDRVKNRPDRIVPTRSPRSGNLSVSTPSVSDFFRIDRNRSEGKTSAGRVDSSSALPLGQFHTLPFKPDGDGTRFSLNGSVEE
ncbi:hypothetical protein MUK42_35310 [Musa troglodytarum]|uniref:Uncharacterized protein n=1 Tax=Musa troglodytarum TaxID=320322 RepID=A0A9E7JXQ8_9LILI|nr:hypothetical protein MUK42_35310 [Musa troglodytarum]